ncbi:MAG: hypothetical protein KA419_01620 [Acidobacteria bacterium]|nr:hypothetical protein [Acidobacteriota bacterium]
MILFMGMVILLLAIPSHLSSPSLSSFTDPAVRRVRVGSYDTAILKPRTAGDLQAWLAANG